MFLTADQVNQLQLLCEKVAANRKREGRVSIVIKNNMPRDFQVEEPVWNDDGIEIGSISHLIRVQLPDEEIRKGRQKNRLPGKKGIRE